MSSRFSKFDALTTPHKGAGWLSFGLVHLKYFIGGGETKRNLNSRATRMAKHSRRRAGKRRDSAKERIRGVWVRSRCVLAGL